MPIKLALASFYTLSLLFGFVAAAIFAVMYLLNIVNIIQVIIYILIINLVLWLAGPYLIDFVHKVFYKIRFLNREEVQNEHPLLEEFIDKTTKKHSIPFPAIGIINDENPTAYCYGSGAFNARIVITTGLFTYLEKEEINSVLAHEIGHIVHGDFIVMSIANVILQILFEISHIFMKGRFSKGKARGVLAIVGIIAYIFYKISYYIVLFLNRIREAYADEFAANTTCEPHHLSKALIKIGYGITSKENASKSRKLIESSQALGIMDFNSAKGVGTITKVTNIEPDKIGKVLLFDIVNPWAKISEFSSTHPLIVKRLSRLDDISVTMGKKPMFNFPKILEENPVNKKRLWWDFFTGAIIYSSPSFLLILILLAYVFFKFNGGIYYFQMKLISSLVMLIGIGIIIKSFYSYFSLFQREAKTTDIYSLMSDPYTSPAKGKFVKLKGKIIGRGAAGHKLSEDILLEDDTGIIYLDYESGIPIIGNILFGIKKVKELIGSPVTATGWFFRSATHKVVLNNLYFNSSRINGFKIFWDFGIGLLILAVGLYFLIGM